MRYIETDTGSNANISSATAIGAYTADADRLIICDVSIDQVAGNGDYVMYVTRQINGAGSAYVVLPKTTMTAASGETAISGQSGLITVRSGDIVTAYVDGLAGDTTTPDWSTRWFELAALRPTTADRTLDVAATGEAGLDFDNIKAASAPTTLTNITVPTVTTTTTATTATSVTNAVTVGAINAAGLADLFDTDSGTTYASAVAGSPVKEIASNAAIASIAAAAIQSIFNASLTEGYAADGAAATLAQALYEIMQFHNEREVGASTITVKKRDGSTTAFTLTYDADSITRAT